MTEHIGYVPISSVQNVELSRAGEKEEIDLVTEESNVVLSGVEEGQDIQIDFTIFGEDSLGNDVETQRKNLKTIIGEDAIDNPFIYEDLKGFISVTEVSVPESSERRNIITGSISGVFLPWPKHFTDSPTPIHESEYGSFGRTFGRIFGGNEYAVGEFGRDFGNRFGGS